MEVLEAYKEGTLFQLWQDTTNRLIAEDSKLSPLRAGSIAAAKLAASGYKKYVELEEKYRIVTELDENDKDLMLYDWLLTNDDQPTWTMLLVDYSGSRTLIADMQG